MSAQESVKAITLVEAGDPLGLWKYARAHHRIRQTAQVVATDVLDEYELYRSSQHSYYFSDDRQLNWIWIAPGDGLEMRRKIAERLDPHANSMISLWHWPMRSLTGEC
jgi:hypothetical protein